MTRYKNEFPQLLAVPPEGTFDGTWPFEARYTEAPGFRMHYVDSYRRLRSFSSAFMTIQSRSPRSSR